eukprot:TRINITY_DN16436_c0_g1_i1.p1 TRINITY_DN16436_c0_g1~~TRINITY_DN16436_c0_g1_i1.p1  ORF type:complete len:280 (-),score=5.66 TRINITY_DN16436_c0_g1_i1:248-1087(-)
MAARRMPSIGAAAVSGILFIALLLVPAIPVQARYMPRGGFIRRRILKAFQIIPPWMTKMAAYVQTARPGSESIESGTTDLPPAGNHTELPQRASNIRSSGNSGIDSGSSVNSSSWANPNAWSSEMFAQASVSPPPSPPPAGDCPPSTEQCYFFFDGHDGMVPEFKMPPLGSGDVQIGGTIAAAVKGSVVTVISINTDKATYPCNVQAMPADDQFYGTQDKIQVRTVQPQNVGKYQGIYVKVPIKSAQLEVYNQVFNLNPGDRSTSFPEDKRCVVFKLSG